MSERASHGKGEGERMGDKVRALKLSVRSRSQIRLIEIRAHHGRHQNPKPKSAKAWPNSNSGSADLDPIRPTSVEMDPESINIGPGSTNFGPNSGKFCPMSINTDPISTNTGNFGDPGSPNVHHPGKRLEQRRAIWSKSPQSLSTPR